MPNDGRPFPFPALRQFLCCRPAKGQRDPATSASTRGTAPAAPGHYRLFVEAHDGQGHAAYANLPFRVAGDAQD